MISATYPIIKIAGNTAVDVIQFAMVDNQLGSEFFPSSNTSIGALLPNGPHSCFTIVPLE